MAEMEKSEMMEGIRAAARGLPKNKCVHVLNRNTPSVWGGDWPKGEMLAHVVDQCHDARARLNYDALVEALAQARDEHRREVSRRKAHEAEVHSVIFDQMDRIASRLPDLTVLCERLRGAVAEAMQAHDDAERRLRDARNALLDAEAMHEWRDTGEDPGDLPPQRAVPPPIGERR